MASAVLIAFFTVASIFIALSGLLHIVSPQLPQFFQDLLLYGKARGKRKEKSFVQYFECPKQWVLKHTSSSWSWHVSQIGVTYIHALQHFGCTGVQIFRPWAEFRPLRGWPRCSLRSLRGCTDTICISCYMSHHFFKMSLHVQHKTSLDVSRRAWCIIITAAYSGLAQIGASRLSVKLWWPFIPLRLTRRMGHLCCNQNQNDDAL